MSNITEATSQGADTVDKVPSGVPFNDDALALFDLIGPALYLCLFLQIAILAYMLSRPILLMLGRII